jgi:hypothetical protein
MFVNNTIIPNRHLNYRNSQDGVPQIFRLKGLRLRHVKEKCQYNLLDKIKMIRNRMILMMNLFLSMKHQKQCLKNWIVASRKYINYQHMILWKKFFTHGQQWFFNAYRCQMATICLQYHGLCRSIWECPKLPLKVLLDLCKEITAKNNLLFL